MRKESQYAGRISAQGELVCGEGQGAEVERVETKAFYYKRYALRYAAGTYWLVDIGQRGLDYRPPLQLNPMGADIVRRLSAGEAEEEIIRRLWEEYEAGDDRERALIRRDVEGFLRTLREKDIEITEEKGTVIL